MTAAVTLATLGNGPAFSAYLPANQVIANNTITKVPMSLEEFDTNSCFDTTNYRFLPTVAGYYQINVAAYISGTAVAGYIIAYIYKNGSSYKFVIAPYVASNGIGGTSLSSVIYCNGTTDYIEFYVYQNTGASQGLIGTNSTQIVFNGALVRGA